MTTDPAQSASEEPRRPRRVVAVDVETSALHPAKPSPGILGMFDPSPTRAPYGVVVEAGWYDFSTGESGVFVPRHSVQCVRAAGAAPALVVCRYLERLADADQDDGTEVRALHERLKGATLAGANPAFDAAFLRAMFQEHHLDPEPWHYRLFDLEAFHAARAGRHAGEMIGLAKIADELGIATRPDHTALNDVLATADAMRKLGAVDGTPVVSL